MADFTFRGVSGYMTPVKQFWASYGTIIINVTIMVMAILIIWILADVSSIKKSVVETQKKTESLYANPGNRSPLRFQIREGRETLQSGVLATGYDADPSAFCADVGTDQTTDPWGFLMGTVSSTDGDTEALGTKPRTTYARPSASLADRTDQMLAMSGAGY